MLNEEEYPVEIDDIIKKVTATYRKLYQPTSQSMNFKLKRVGGEFIYMYVSEEFRLSLGLDGELVGCKLGSLSKKGEYEKLKSIFEKVWMGNMIVYCTSSDIGLELIVCISPIFQRNNVVGIKGNCMDITKWRMQNKRVSFCDTKGNFVYTDKENEVVSGYSVNSLLSNTIFTLLHPDDKDVLRKKLVNILNTRKPGYASYRIKKANGRWMRVNAYGIPFLDENDECLGVAIFTDSKQDKGNHHH